MIRIRVLTMTDIPIGMRLKEQASWNQLETDWRRLISLQPDGCFLAEWDGVPAGTVTTCRFGPVAWIAMMLVDVAFRRKGIGRSLMVHALAALESQGVRSIRLDATPLGEPLYESLGFKAEMTLARYHGTLPRNVNAPTLPNVLVDQVFDEILALDQAVTGTDRGRLLKALITEHPASLRVGFDGSAVSGYVLARPGSKARQIGPCIAQSDVAPVLLDDAACRYAGETVVLDVPTTHEPACRIVESWGLRPLRILTRMGYGPRVAEDLDRLWASAGAEKG